MSKAKCILAVCFTEVLMCMSVSMVCMSISMSPVNLMSNVRWGLSGWNTADWCSRKPLTCSRCSSYPCFKAAGFGFWFCCCFFYCLERLKSGARKDFVLDMRTWQTDEFSENFQSPCFKVFVSVCCLASVMFFSVVTVVVAFVLFGSAEEWYDGSHWHAGGAGGVTDRMLLELCVCVAQGGRLPTPSDPFP